MRRAVPLVVDHCTVDDETRHFDQKTSPFVSPGSYSVLFRMKALAKKKTEILQLLLVSSTGGELEAEKKKVSL